MPPSAPLSKNFWMLAAIRHANVALKKEEIYRFHKPSDQGFPFMIELFSRKPGTLDLPENAERTPIPVEEDIVSLSAILLDDGYYEALNSAKRRIEQVTVIDETLLIPFKARAFLDLSAIDEATMQELQRYGMDINRASWVIETAMGTTNKESAQLPEK